MKIINKGFNWLSPEKKVSQKQIEYLESTILRKISIIENLIVIVYSKEKSCTIYDTLDFIKMIVDTEVNNKILFDIYTGKKIDIEKLFELLEKQPEYNFLKKTMLDYRIELKALYGYDDLEKDKKDIKGSNGLHGKYYEEIDKSIIEHVGKNKLKKLFSNNLDLLILRNQHSFYYYYNLEETKKI
jgi:hypothetical protein